MSKSEIIGKHYDLTNEQAIDLYDLAKEERETCDRLTSDYVNKDEFEQASEWAKKSKYWAEIMNVLLGN